MTVVRNRISTRDTSSLIHTQFPLFQLAEVSDTNESVGHQQSPMSSLLTQTFLILRTLTNNILF